MANVIPVKLREDQLAHTPMDTSTGDKVPAVFIPVSSSSDNILGVDDSGNLYVPASGSSVPSFWDASYGDTVLAPNQKTVASVGGVRVNGDITFDETSGAINTGNTAGLYLVVLSLMFSLDSITQVQESIRLNTQGYLRIENLSGATSDFQILLDQRYHHPANAADLFSTRLYSSQFLGIAAESKCKLVLSGGASGISCQALDVKLSAYRLAV